MQYQTLETVKLPISRMILGTGIDAFWQGKNCDLGLDTAFQLGINTFDTARMYGKAENVLGDWIERRNLREKVNILSKGGHPGFLGIKRLSQKAILADVEASLQALKTDYIDIYLLHRDNPSVPVDEMVETLNILYVKGKIHAFGGSNWTHQRLQEANEYAYKHNMEPFRFSSPCYGLASMKKSLPAYDMVGVRGDVQAEEWYRENQMPLLAYSPLGHGLFTGKIDTPKQLSPLWVRSAFGTEENFATLQRCRHLAIEKEYSVAQIALAWAMRGEMNVFPIVGTASPKHLRASVEAMEISLTEEEYSYLSQKA